MICGLFQRVKSKKQGIQCPPIEVSFHGAAFLKVKKNMCNHSLSIGPILESLSGSIIPLAFGCAMEILDRWLTEERTMDYVMEHLEEMPILIQNFIGPI